MKHFIVIFVLVFALSCQKNQKPSYGKEKPEVVTNYPGKKIMENKCYVCHSTAASENDRIAPPMIAIKKHYIFSETTKEEFIKDMQNWIQHPTPENAKMKGAVRRFGVMPKQYFSKEDIKKIAEYMFDNDIEKPKWFEEHYNKERGKGKHKYQIEKNSNTLSYKERGLKYALATKTVLGKNLIGKTQKDGTLSALKFCNINAYPLTDSMAKVNEASIKRVSDKPRNLKNLANTVENKYINVFKEDVKLGKDSEPIVIESINNVKVYYPIKTNSMCMQCHGTKTADINANVLMQIDSLYPEDMATGYTENQVRGIWSISFNK